MEVKINRQYLKLGGIKLEDKDLLNKINREVSSLFIKGKIECNIIGCKNKPIHKFKVINIENRFVYSCNKHKEDFKNHKWYKGSV